MAQPIKGHIASPVAAPLSPAVTRPHEEPSAAAEVDAPDAPGAEDACGGPVDRAVRDDPAVCWPVPEQPARPAASSAIVVAVRTAGRGRGGVRAVKIVGIIVISSDVSVRLAGVQVACASAERQ